MEISFLIISFLIASFSCFGVSPVSGFNLTCHHGTPSKAICGTIFDVKCPKGFGCVTNPQVADAQGICCPIGDDVDYMEIRMSIFSGREDPVFGIFASNPNFTAILTRAKTREPGTLASVMGYRGFEITLYTGVNHTVPFYLPYRQTVTIGKCEEPDFEEKLLQTVANLPDHNGGKLLPAIVQQVDNNIRACTGNISFMQVTVSMYSGRQDPKFNVNKANENFTAIATSLSSRTSTPLTGILGYRGFVVRLYEYGRNGTKIVSVGKCSYPGLEKKLLQTISNLPDTQGGVMLPSTVQYVIDEINGCSTQKR